MKSKNPKTPTDEEVRKAAQILGALGGSSRSEKKQEASRTNGKLGGRPKKPKTTDHGEKTEKQKSRLGKNKRGPRAED